jgi:hypothetical protein
MLDTTRVDPCVGLHFKYDQAFLQIKTRAEVTGSDENTLAYNNKKLFTSIVS